MLLLLIDDRPWVASTRYYIHRPTDHSHALSLSHSSYTIRSADMKYVQSRTTENAKCTYHDYTITRPRSMIMCRHSSDSFFFLYFFVCLLHLSRCSLLLSFVDHLHAWNARVCCVYVCGLWYIIIIIFYFATLFLACALGSIVLLQQQQQQPQWIHNTTTITSTLMSTNGYWDFFFQFFVYLCVCSASLFYSPSHVRRLVCACKKDNESRSNRVRAQCYCLHEVCVRTLRVCMLYCVYVQHVYVPILCL